MFPPTASCVPRPPPSSAWWRSPNPTAGSGDVSGAGDPPGAHAEQAPVAEAAHHQFRGRRGQVGGCGQPGSDAWRGVPNARTLLIEADLRRPSASKLLTHSSLRGISDWDAGKLALEDSLYQVNDLPLWFLSAGHGMEEPLPLLESDRFAKMLDTISSSFDWVLLDATPMLPMADSTSLSRLCDGVLVVVREGFTRRKVLDKALESIEKSKLLGMVFNEASMLNIDYDRYYGEATTHPENRRRKPRRKPRRKRTR